VGDPALDTPATLTLRATCRARKDLVAYRVALVNQLRAHLAVTFPGAVGLFSDIDSNISLRFLRRLPDQQRADWPLVKRLHAWLSSVGYSGHTSAEILHRHLTDAPCGLTGDGGARAQITLALITTLEAILAQTQTLADQIEEQLTLHPDAEIFTILPRGGQIRAARLLAEIGEARGRFPTPDSLICLAGVAPSTRQSGKVKIVSFRWSADKQLRDAVCDFAGDSRHASPWAHHLYDQAIARGHDHPHAVRILARSWLGVIWKCWQTNTPYDPTRHRAAQAHQHRAA
jgi:transposase